MGMGMERDNQRGNMIIQFEMIFPSKLSKDQISGLKGNMGSFGLNSGNTQGMINSALQQAGSMNPQVQLAKAADQVAQSDNIKDDLSDALDMF